MERERQDADPARYATLAIQILMFLLTSVYTLRITARSEGAVRSRHLTIGLFGIAMNDPTASDKVKEYLAKIGSSAQHLLGIINDILDMSRIESGLNAHLSKPVEPEMLYATLGEPDQVSRRRANSGEKSSND